MKKPIVKKLLFFSFLVCFVVLLLMPEVAGAERKTQVTTSIKPKALNLTVPSSVTINPIDVSITEVETTGVVGDVEVSDLRGKRVPLGWSLTVTATDFTSADNDVIPVAKLNSEVGQYKFINGTDGGITIPGKFTFADSNSDGTSDAATLLIAKPGSGAGRFIINPILRLLVPAFSVAADYQSTLTLTLS